MSKQHGVHLITSHTKLVQSLIFPGSHEYYWHYWYKIHRYAPPVQSGSPGKAPRPPAGCPPSHACNSCLGFAKNTVICDKGC